MFCDDHIETDKKIDSKLYTDSIPKCCSLQTYEEHRDILWYCWGLINSINNGVTLDCKGCDFIKKDDQK